LKDLVREMLQIRMYCCVQLMANRAAITQAHGINNLANGMVYGSV